MIVPERTTVLHPFVAPYIRRYLARSFHAVHLFGQTPAIPDDDGVPMLVCMNHSSWWDVLLAYYVEREFFGWERYGVMDARQLERYKILAKLGMLAVDRTSLTGAKEFLEYAADLLRGHRRALWLTPQGAMVSNVSRPIAFQPGIAHLAQRLGRFHLARVCLHYEFWDDKLPEAFVSISSVDTYDGSAGFARRTFLRAQEGRLEAEIEALLLAVRARDPARFRPLLKGRSGISPTYEGFKALSARIRGQSAGPPDHSAVRTPGWSHKKDAP